ncbi:MAG: bifunctional folylpolyglutamate synthase/dihydrofolate synthase, partial [Dehalococcoidia bacterium]
MNYQQALDYILSFADFERSGRFADRPDLTPVRSLLQRLGDPQRGRTTVHVAGSKGKGSVAAILESVLRHAGFRTGLFTSPHLHSFCERIRIDGQPVEEGEFVHLAEAVQPAVAAEMAARPQRQFVTFDLLTAMAFLAFRDGGAQVQVVEVGLGGRLDSTNLLDEKDVCIISPISLEHTAVLGDTVERIAVEKAAIVQPGASVVMAPQAYPEAAAAVRRAAAQAGAEVVEVAANYRWERLSHDLEGQEARLSGPGGVRDLRLSLLGGFQLENAATALAAVDVLRARALPGPSVGRPVGPGRRGHAIGDDAIARGLAAVRWPGRLEVLSPAPLIVADGAHNRDSARCLRESLDYFSRRRTFFIVGTLTDKDVAAIAAELAPLADRVIACGFDHPRAMAPEAIAAAFADTGRPAQVRQTLAGAIEEAVALADPDWLICITGAVAVAAVARSALARLLRRR